MPIRLPSNVNCETSGRTSDGGERAGGLELMDGETSFPFIVFHREQQMGGRAPGRRRVDWRKSEEGNVLWAT